MTFFVRHLRLRAVTDEGSYGADLSFGPGLNILRGANSQGKSTCLQAVIYVLGLERMFGPQRLVPLPPALTKELLTPDERELPVLGSWAAVELENSRGEVITVQRAIKTELDNRLVSVWAGATITSLAQGTQRDFFLRDPGSASREAGFHHFLERFIGWELPSVAKLNGTECLLYMELLFPFAYVEQKHGWSAVGAGVPRFLQVREPEKRAIEFLLGLDANDVAKARSSLAHDEDRLRSEWSRELGGFEATIRPLFATAVGLPTTPIVNWRPEVAPRIDVLRGNVSVSLEESLRGDKALLEDMRVAPVDRTDVAAERLNDDLKKKEAELIAAESSSNNYFMAVQAELFQIDGLSRRIKAIEEDIRKHQDVVKLRVFGSGVQLSLAHQDCPTCGQTVEDTLLAQTKRHRPMSIEDNIGFLQEQRSSFLAMADHARVNLDLQQRRLGVARAAVELLRSGIRSLKDALTESSSSPSVADVRARVQLENTVALSEKVLESFGELLVRLDGIASEWKVVQGQKARLPTDSLSGGDSAKLAAFQTQFVAQLIEYGMSSVKPSSVQLSPETYRPSRDGFDLRFDLSASDNIRTIWAYMLALMQVARSTGGRHPGMLFFDEPRQHEADPVSFAALLRRAAVTTADGGQVILATSEKVDDLRRDLGNTPHSMLRVEGRFLKPLTA